MDGIEIENLTSAPLWLRLNSGQHLYIGPHARSRFVGSFEIALNSEFSRLLEKQRIRSWPRMSLLQAAPPDAPAPAR